MAIPHAPISKNVLKTGISLLIVKEKVLFPNGKGANIFLSFATTNKTEHLGILNDLFELITKYNFIENKDFIAIAQKKSDSSREWNYLCWSLNDK